MTKLLLIGFVFFSLSANVSAQSQKNEIHSPNKTEQIAADENFEINITQKRLTENDFVRSTSVNVSNSKLGGLRIEVGVGVRADNINALLRGIFGQVRFRASLESLRQKIEKFKTSPVNGNQ